VRWTSHTDAATNTQIAQDVFMSKLVGLDTLAKINHKRREAS